MAISKHLLFRQYPLVGSRTLSNGVTVPVPYHIYNGNILMIGGTADYNAVEKALKSETVVPVRDRNGQALMAVWICDFLDASLGAHKELQFSIFVSRQLVDPLPAHPFTILEETAFNPDVRMLCYRLWNDTETVVCYNTELLGLNAKLAKGVIDQTIRFKFEDDQVLAEGNIRPYAQPTPGMLMQLIRHFGFSKLRKLAGMSWVSMQVVNPINQVLPINAEAQAYSKSDVQITRLFDPDTDEIKINLPVNFKPQFVSQMSNCKFVYLNPHND